MAIGVTYGVMKGKQPGAIPYKLTGPVNTGSVIVPQVQRGDDIPRLLSMKALNQISAAKRAAPKLLPFAVYKARLRVFGECRNYGLVPGRMVTTVNIANQHGNKLTEVAINDCALMQWSFEAQGDQAWRPIRCEWFDNSVTYNEHPNLVLIEAPK